MTEPRDAYAEEERRIRVARFLADLTLSRLAQDDSLTLLEALQLVERTRDAILRLFPGKERAFELLHQPRFDRVLRARWPIELPEEAGTRFRIR